MYTDVTDKNLITMTLEDDSVIKLQPIITTTIEDKTYIALTTPDDESEDVYFYNLVQHDGNEIELLKIEDKDVLDKVMDEFEKWIDDQEGNGNNR